MFAFPGQQIDEVDSRIKDVGARLTAARKASEVSQRLETIPGLSYAKVRKTTRALVVVQAHDLAWLAGRRVPQTITRDYIGIQVSEHSSRTRLFEVFQDH